MGLKFAGRMAAATLTLGAVASAGQALAQTYTSRVEKVVTYTANGHVQTEADGKNNLTTYEYDGFDRLVKVRYPDPNTPGVSSTTDYEQYGYDAAGNRTTQRKRSGETVTFIYDAMNRVAYHDGVQTWYYYDNLDHPTWGYAGANYAAITVRTYDALGRVTQDYAHLNGTYLPISYQYDAAGNRVRMTWPDGFYVTYDYDNTGAVTAIRENGSTALATYTYDDLGRKTSTALANGANTQYGYDAASRLNSLSLYLADPAKRQAYSLTYNAASQVTSRAASNPLYEWADLQASKAYNVNGLNQYTSAGGLAVGYDTRGNMTNNGGATFGYDLENRLTSASGGAALSYDPIGRLQEIAKPGYQTERLAYDGPNLVTEYDTANTIMRRYVPGPGVDEPVVWYEGSGTSDRRFYLRDMQDSIISVSNNAGVAIKTYTYDEYGVPGGDTDGRFRYTGQTWLPQVGLYHYKARVYSPTLGRFLQTDPIGYGDGLNWYAYTHNDPLNFKDPTGTAAWIAETSCGEYSDKGAGVSGGYCKTTYRSAGGKPAPPPKQATIPWAQFYRENRCAIWALGDFYQDVGKKVQAGSLVGGAVSSGVVLTAPDARAKAAGFAGLDVSFLGFELGSAISAVGGIHKLVAGDPRSSFLDAAAHLFGEATPTMNVAGKFGEALAKQMKNEGDVAVGMVADSVSPETPCGNQK